MKKKTQKKKIQQAVTDNGSPKKKPKIFWVSSVGYSTSGYGVVTNSILPRFIKHGYEVVNFCPDQPFSPHYTRCLNSDVEILTCGSEDQNDADILTNALRYYKMFGCDICISLCDAWSWNREWGKHFPLWIAYSPVDSNPIGRDSYKALMDCYKVVAFSEFAKREYAKVGIESEIVYHGVDTKLFRSMNKTKCKTRHGIKTDAFIFGATGVNWMDRKNYPGMIDAFSRFVHKTGVKNAYLYIHAKRYRNGVNCFDLERLAELCNVSDRVLFPQYVNVPREEMATLYNCMDVYVSASKGEGCGLGILEAQACQVPCIVPNNCYSSDTEILTPQGIKKPTELSVGNYVWSINLKTRVLEAKKILKKYEYRHDGDMVCFKANKYDLIVTPNHKMIFGKRSSRHDYRFIEANKVFLRGNQTVWLPIVCNWTGKINEHIDTDTFSCDSLSNSNRSNKLPKTVSLPDFLELCGWYIGDGSCSYDKRCQHQTTTTIWEPKNGKHRNDLTALLKRIGIKYSEERLCVKFNYYGLTPIWDQIGHSSKTKKIPSWMLEYNKSALFGLYRGMMYSDGSNLSCSNSTVYRTASKALRDGFIELCLKVGYSPSYCRFMPSIVIKKDGKTIVGSGGWNINVSIISTNGSMRSKRNAKVVKYKGDIWCFEVEANHNMLVGRNGKFCFSGNSVQPEWVTDHGWVVPCSHREVSLLTPLHNWMYWVDVDKMADAMEEAYCNAKKRETFGRDARTAMLAFDWDKIVDEQWVPLLERCLDPAAVEAQMKKFNWRSR